VVASSGSLGGSALRGDIVVVLDALVDAQLVGVGLGRGAVTLRALGNTGSGGVDLRLVGRGDSNAVSLAVDITSITGVDTGVLGLLGRVERDRRSRSSRSGRARLGGGSEGGKEAGQDNGETHRD
jgi:hypothetical protein